MRIQFFIPGNQENPKTGNPIPYYRTTQRAKWKDKGARRYAAWKKYVQGLAVDHALKLNFTRFQVEAALFHELSHIRLDPETDEPLVVPHDFEGFIRELETYGTWTEDLFRLKASMEQMKLL